MSRGAACGEVLAIRFTEKIMNMIFCSESVMNQLTRFWVYGNVGISIQIVRLIAKRIPLSLNQWL